MQRLVLLRHAKSAYPPGVQDHDRPLNDRGLANAATIADRLRPFLLADATVRAAVSTATRTQQTWEIANAELGVEHWSDRGLYLADPASLMEAASVMEADIGIIVGHNPGIEDVARSARGSHIAVDAATQHRMADKFPTSSFAVLECESGDWRHGELILTGFAVCR